jgi:hypothetical protein
LDLDEELKPARTEGMDASKLAKEASTKLEYMVGKECLTNVHLRIVEYRSDEACERQLMMLAAEYLIPGDI